MKKVNLNTNAESIKQFLLMRPRTRKEIVKFVYVTLNENHISDSEFNLRYKNDLRGHYSTAFRDWKRNKTVKVIDKKYHVTKECFDLRVGLYYTMPSVYKDRADEYAKRYTKLYRANRKNEAIIEEKQRVINYAKENYFEANKEIKIVEGRLDYEIDQNNNLRAENEALRGRLAEHPNLDVSKMHPSRKLELIKELLK
jgi:hypothetical protein